ncbi:AIR carboxylase family protein [Coxiella-like endosymbiont of Rhipicephalus sanguineus]|uniref:AIR carboxylase family protein n=1 Tax=Coxiella-like endosymbiont of Rhipicephalus sanguineus TaxID=1955402 RepID=UPI0020426BC9|nr:AIR carboxylase family protein [Coxiella-like endosymbiont of Rhipicephalus sanguineus]
MNKSFIAILMGSDSNLSVIETTFTELKSLGIPFEACILSVHRTPEATRDFVETAEKRGCTVFHRCRWTRCPSSRMALIQSSLFWCPHDRWQV